MKYYKYYGHTGRKTYKKFKLKSEEAERIFEIRASGMDIAKSRESSDFILPSCWDGSCIPAVLFQRGHSAKVPCPAYIIDRRQRKHRPLRGISSEACVSNCRSAFVPLDVFLSGRVGFVRVG